MSRSSTGLSIAAGLALVACATLVLGLAVIGGIGQGSTSASVVTIAQLAAETCTVTGPIKGLTAAQAGLPVLDGDGMGRAFPELQMVTFTLHGVSATPMVVVDDKGNSILLECIDNRWTERLARTATIEMGGSVLITLYPMSGEVAKRAAVRGTLTLARRLGEILRESRAAHR